MIDSWRPGRDSDGWKVTNSVAGYWDEKSQSWTPLGEDSPLAPMTVKAVPRLEDDLRALA
jgi:hypothetical protein